MIEETAIVVARAGRYVQIETDRRTACGSCSAAGGCTSSLLAQVFGNRRSQMLALNDVGAQPGDQVLVGLAERALLRASLAVYLAPVGGLLGGALLGQVIGSGRSPGETELISIVSGLLGMSIVFAWLRFFTNRPRDRLGCQAVVLKRLQAMPIDLDQSDPVGR